MDLPIVLRQELALPATISPKLTVVRQRLFAQESSFQNVAKTAYWEIWALKELPEKEQKTLEMALQPCPIGIREI